MTSQYDKEWLAQNDAILIPTEKGYKVLPATNVRGHSNADSQAAEQKDQGGFKKFLTDSFLITTAAISAGVLLSGLTGML